jgi:hypothetical protein
MTTPRRHRRIEIPLITVYCDDAIHAEKRSVTHRLGKYPAGAFGGVIEGWHMLSDLYEDEFDDITADHRRRFADEIVTVGGHTRYNLKCPTCARRGKRRPITVPIHWDKLQLVCEYIVAAGRSSVALTEIAAIVSRSAGRKH